MRNGSLLPRLERPDDCPPCRDRLDRQGWPVGLVFESHGARLGIRVTEASVLPRLAALLPPGSTPADSPLVDALYSLQVAAPGTRPQVRRYHLLYRGSRQIARTTDLSEALAALEADLHGSVAAWARERLFVHAGVVAWRGQALVIPGRSFSGKSSLVRALASAGAAYLSDEYAVFDRHGYVHPYARRLVLRDAQGRPLAPCTAEFIGGSAASGPLPVGVILSTWYEAGARWQPRPHSPARALLTLLDNTVQVREQPQMALGSLQKAALEARAFAGKRGEAAQVLAWLEKGAIQTGG